MLRVHTDLLRAIACCARFQVAWLTMGGTGTVVTDNNTVKGALEELDAQVTTNVSDISTNDKWFKALYPKRIR